MTPPRETVAGEQWFMWLISSSRRMLGASGMRSLLASVSILLSSITVFMLCATAGPSLGQHHCSPCVLSQQHVECSAAQRMSLVMLRWPG